LKQHPYIHRIADVDYIPDRKLVVIIEPFVSRGSLKDLIYQTTPSLSWATKYSVRRNGLNLNQIKNYGRQILEAVSYLLFVGFNPFGQIQSGNIYVEGSRCRLSGCDNSLLGYKPRIFRTLKHYKDSIDSAMFGHLLYELSSGRELTSPAPNEEDYDNIRLPQVVQVIKFIFQNESGRIPSIADILELPFFKNVKTPELDHWNSSEHVVIEQDVTDIIAKSKKGRTKHSTKKSRTSRGGASEAAAYPTFQAKGTTGAAPSNTSSTASNKASSRTTKPSAPPSTSTAATDRTSLLSDIRSGTPLRHTETNDRSAPIIS
jgi:PX domain-containing protein kinase-like protein